MIDLYCDNNTSFVIMRLKPKHKLHDKNLKRILLWMNKLIFRTYLYLFMAYPNLTVNTITWIEIFLYKTHFECIHDDSGITRSYVSTCQIFMLKFFIFHTLQFFCFYFHSSFEIFPIDSNTRFRVKITRWIFCYFCFIQYVESYWGKCLSCFPEYCWRSPCCLMLFILTT